MRSAPDFTSARGTMLPRGLSRIINATRIGKPWCAFSYRKQYARSSSPDGKRSPRLRGLQRPIPRIDRRLSPAQRPGAPIRHRFLEALLLYSTTSDRYAELSALVSKTRKARIGIQAEIDVNVLEKDFMQRDDRMDYAIHVEEAKVILRALQGDMNAKSDELHQYEDELVEVKKSVDASRSRMLEMVPAYNDEVLIFDWKEPWCISRRGCGILSQLKATCDLEQVANAEAMELKFRLSRLRSAEWLRQKTMSVGQVGWQANQTATDAQRLQQEMQSLQFRLRKLEDESTLRRENMALLERPGLDIDIRNTLTRAGRITATAPSVPVDEADRQAKTPDSPEGERSVSRSSYDRGWDARDPTTAEGALRADLDEAAGRLEEAQEHLVDAQRGYYGDLDRELIEHLMAFPRATLASFRDLVDNRTRYRRSDVGYAEEEFKTARHALLDNGFRVQKRVSARGATPETFSETSRRRAQSDAERDGTAPARPHRGRRPSGTPRRHIKAWRTPLDLTGPPRVTEDISEDIYSTSWRLSPTPSAEGSPERNRLLREYNRGRGQ